MAAAHSNLCFVALIRVPLCEREGRGFNPAATGPSSTPGPRNSYELAFRNQFYTPRYVVQFLVDNTLGRIWYEMRKGETALKEKCQYLVWRPNEVLATRDSDRRAGACPGLLDDATGRRPPQGVALQVPTQHRATVGTGSLDRGQEILGRTPCRQVRMVIDCQATVSPRDDVGPPLGAALGPGQAPARRTMLWLTIL